MFWGWTTMNLAEQLVKITPEEFPEFLARNESELIRCKHPFAGYMRKKLREKDITQQNLFLAADLSERYGYKLISEQKHTVKRDVIIRFCLAAKFNLEEAQEALLLYKMPELYWRFPRDAAFIVAFSNKIYDIHQVDSMLLRKNNLPPFLTPDQDSG